MSINFGGFATVMYYPQAQTRSLAAFAGPLLLGLSTEITIFYLFAILLIIALVVGIWLKGLLAKAL